ncbi:MAG: hypothetical protein PHT79_09150, partial [Syntrophomonadaceae bacterium]|nr:hypothetical protein [Syntrophomonadaceae bacterium]MDD4549907.1 hypothetical protein [Syntrophomonadaceae bacterium]
FAAANLLMGLYAGLYDPSFNNYLAQVHHVSEVTRGSLEFPRELPGFLVVFFFTALIFLADTRIGALAAIMVGISLWGQGYLAPGMTSVVFWMLLWSTGAHLFMVQWVFVTAGIIALVTLVVSLRLPRHEAATCNSSLSR